MKRLFIVILTFAIIFGGLFYVFFKDNLHNLSKDTNTKQEIQKIDGSFEQQKEPKLSFSAWVPYWDYDSGLKTLQINDGFFTEILPVIYEVESDGSLKKTKGDLYKNLQKFSRENDIKFIPSIAFFDHETFTQILQNEEILNKHIDSIIGEIDENDFDGIDIDYEATKLDDKAQYEKFISELSARINALEESKNTEITLSITVLPKWTPDELYPSLVETRKVQDWKFLNQYADQIRIMAYDYTSQRSAEPGPISPNYWIRLILSKAVLEIDKEKIILALPNHGYNWAASEIDDNISFLDNPPTDKLRADAFTYNQVLEILDTYEGKTWFNETWGENIYKYTREGADRILVYQDVKSISSKLDIAKEYGIDKISFWRLGHDSKFNYKKLANEN